MSNLLRDIFSQARSAAILETGVLLPSSERVTWLPLLQVSDQGTRMGLTPDGMWVVAGRTGLVQLREPQAFVTTLPLLEKPRLLVIQQMYLWLNAEETNGLVEQMFPFVDIVRMGLEMGFDHWANVALNWFDELSVPQKQQLRDSLIVVSKAKWASQKLRQKAVREISKLER